MARLPIPGNDAGTWGAILNDYLSQAHEANGYLKHTGILATKYTMPSGGIPASDLEHDVRDVLDAVPDHTSELAEHATTLSDHADTLSQHTTELTTKANQADLAAVTTRIDGSLKADGTLKAAVVSRAALDASTVAAVRVAALRQVGADDQGSAPFAPKTMASPPTVTFSANNISGIANRQTFLPDHRVFRYFRSGPVAPAGTSFVASTGRYDALGGVVLAVEYCTDALVIEHAMRANGAVIRIWVDNELVDPAGHTAPNNSGAAIFCIITFADAKPRKVRVEGVVMPFGGVNIGPTDAIWSPIPSRTPRVVLFGDSFVQGTGATPILRGWASQMADHLGWANVIATGIGGTGYTNNAGSLKTYGERIQTDLIDLAPDIYIVAGSTNDQGASASVISQKAGSFWAQARAALPSAYGVCVLPFVVSGSPSAGAISNRNVVKAAAAPYADLIIDPLADGWFTGTGKVGATTGSGNADRFLSSDGVHPSTAGHEYIGRRVAEALLAAMKS